MSDPQNEGMYYRPALGFVCVVGSLIGFGALYVIEVPTGNRDAMMLALGIIFGWGSAVVQAEFGSSNIGRKVAEGAMKRMDRSLPKPAPHDAVEAADQVAHAADEKRDEIKKQESES